MTEPLNEKKTENINEEGILEWFVKTGLKFVGALALIAAVVFLIMNAVLYWSIAVPHKIDEKVSPDEDYTVILKDVYSGREGQLILEESGETVSTHDFNYANDRLGLSEGLWKVTWHEDKVVVIISGNEQYDEQITMWFNGTTESETLTTHFGEPWFSSSDTFTPEIPETEAESDEPQDMYDDISDEDDKILYQVYGRDCAPQIIAGYRAIHKSLSKQKYCTYIVDLDAKAHSEVILYEDSAVIEYIKYDNSSNEGNTNKYVYYKTPKNEDGSWDTTETELLAYYVHYYETGELYSTN